MNNNSFYGGRDGRSLVITKNYPTVEDMLKDFSGLESINPAAPANGKVPGKTGLGVNFGDYVIIETINKNNPENGRIFKRNFNFNDTRNKVESWHLNATTNIYEKKMYPCYGAEYVSQIVGPSGNAPHFISLPTNLPRLDEEGHYIYQTDSEGNFILGENGKQILEYEETLSDYPKVLARYKDYDIRSGEGIFSVSNSHLVPGKIDAENFNDNITWRYCSVRDENQQETNAYIGFTFPYTVIEFEANSVEPYYNRTDRDEADADKRVNFGHDPLVEGRTDDGAHPFYEKWKINIPRGVRGMSIENIGIAATAEKIEQVYAFDFTDKEAEGSRDANTGLLKVKSYDGKDDDKANNRQIMYCTVVDYDRIAAGDRYKIYLGDYNMIIKDQVKFKDDGSLSIDYTHEDKDEWPQKVNWITGISLNKESGEFVLTTNNDNINNIDEKLTWIKEADITTDGRFQTISTTGDNEADTQLNWIKEININPETGAVVYTDVEKVDGINKTYTQDALTWIKNAKITEDGRFQTESTTGDNVVDTQLQWVKEIKFNPDGTITVIDINGAERTGPLDDENNKDAYKNLIKWITNISLDVNTGAFKIDYNNGDTSLEKSLQWVKDIFIDETGKMTTDYTNQDNRVENNKFTWISEAEVNENKDLNITFNNSSINNINVPLKTPNKIELIDGVIYATYNTSTTPVALGSVENQISACAGTEADPNLNVGGVWFEVIEG